MSSFINIGPYTRLNKDNITYINYFEKDKKLLVGFLGGQPYSIDLSAVEEPKLTEYLTLIFDKLK
jgi:hypothetical protein